MAASLQLLHLCPSPNTLCKLLRFNGHCLRPGFAHVLGACTSTWCRSLGTKYFGRDTCTKYLVSDIWYQVVGTRYLLPSIRCKVLSAKY